MGRSSGDRRVLLLVLSVVVVARSGEEVCLRDALVDGLSDFVRAVCEVVKFVQHDIVVKLALAAPVRLIFHLPERR